MSHLLGGRGPKPRRPPISIDVVTTEKKLEKLQQVSRGLTALSSGGHQGVEISVSSQCFTTPKTGSPNVALLQLMLFVAVCWT